ncbi:MAG: Crp/Fnr family transcriptional regulator [Rhodospirillaceae bacterium]
MGSGFDQKSFERRQFAAGEYILQQGEIGHRAYLVEIGTVEISRGIGERKRTLGRVGPGGIFGELAPLDGLGRVADAKALTDAICLVIPADLLRDKVEKCDPVIRALLRIMARNLRSLTDALTEDDY